MNNDFDDMGQTALTASMVGMVSILALSLAIGLGAMIASHENVATDSSE